MRTHGQRHGIVKRAVGWVVLLAAAAVLWNAYPADAQAASARRAICHRADLPAIPGRYKVKGRPARWGQRRNMAKALNVARRMRAPEAHYVAIIAAMINEASGWKPPYGPGPSVGILQLINTHGSFAWRMKIRNSAGWFLRGARRVDPYGRMHPGALADAIERPAIRGGYYQRVGNARRIVRLYHRGCPVRRARR